MTFNLTPTIKIETQEDLELALEGLAGEATPEWIETLRVRGEKFLGGSVELDLDGVYSILPKVSAT